MQPTLDDPEAQADGIDARAVQSTARLQPTLGELGPGYLRLRHTENSHDIASVK